MTRLEKLGIFFGVAGAFGVLLSIVVGISAGVAFIVEHLWNFVMVGVHRGELRVSFWVTWAAMFLLGLITRPFRLTITTSKD